MRFGIRELALDLALVIFVAAVWYADRGAVYLAIQAIRDVIVGR